MGCELWIGWFAYKGLLLGEPFITWLALGGAVSPESARPQDVEASNTETRKHYYKSLNNDLECPENLCLVLSLIYLQTANRC